MSISVIINTKNSASTLKRALDSVAWADQLVVMDMHSTDQTEAVAKKSGAEFYLHKDVGYVEPARNAAIAKASSDWVLILDSDEEVPPTLATKINALVAGDATAEAYSIPRKNQVFGQWYQYAGWWPDYQLRLFKKGAVTWSDKIHHQPKITGNHDFIAATESNAINHYNYQSIEQFIDRLNRYTSHEVDARAEKRTVVNTATVISAFKNELFSRLFHHKGIDGGLHGVSISLLQALYEVVVQLKQWQMTDFKPQQQQQQQTITALRSLQQDLNYWIADWNVQHSTGLAQLVWRLRKRFKV